LFRQLLRWSDRTDAALLHCVAAAAANLGFYDRAKRIWDEVAALDPDSEIPAFFLNKVNEALEKGVPMQSVSYQYHIPFQEQFKIMKEQLQTGKLGGWRNDPLIRSSLFWALRHGDVETKTQVIQTFALIADKEVEHALREFIKDPEELDQLKRMALVVLRHMGAEGPFAAHLEQEDVLMPGQNVPQDELLTCNTEWQEVLDGTINEMADTLGDEACQLARDIWTDYLNRVLHAPPKISKVASWSAALEYTVLRRMGIRVSQADVAKRYGVSTGSVSKIFRVLTEKPLEDQ
ncbi:MAG: DDE transposase family protein, partial [Tumebacillaceae bacterium]